MRTYLFYFLRWRQKINLISQNRIYLSEEVFSTPQRNNAIEEVFQWKFENSSKPAKVTRYIKTVLKSISHVQSLPSHQYWFWLFSIAFFGRLLLESILAFGWCFWESNVIARKYRLFYLFGKYFNQIIGLAAATTTENHQKETKALALIVMSGTYPKFCLFFI